MSIVQNPSPRQVFLPNIFKLTQTNTQITKFNFRQKLVLSVRIVTNIPVDNQMTPATLRACMVERRQQTSIEGIYKRTAPNRPIASMKPPAEAATAQNTGGMSEISVED